MSTTMCHGNARTFRPRGRLAAALCVATVVALITEPLTAWPARAQAGCSNTITGTAGDDVLTGTEMNDCIFGMGGDDEIYGLDGDDRLAGGDGDDLLSGGPGVDWIAGGAGADTVDGDEGNDDLSGGTGDDDMDGLGGNDRISGGTGDDYLVGGEDNDSVVGGDGDDLLDDAFDEPLETSGSDDLLVGGAGEDELLGGPGADRLEAWDGLPGELVDGGEGPDTCTMVDEGEVVSNCEPPTGRRGRASAQAAAPATATRRRAPLRIPVIDWNVHERLSNDQQIADILFEAVGAGSGDLKLAGLQEMCFNQINDVVESDNRLEDKTGRDWSWETSDPWGDRRKPWCMDGNVVLASVPVASISNESRRPFTAQKDDECPNLSDDDDECRSYVRMDVSFAGRKVRVYSTHIATSGPEQALQIAQLAREIRQEREVIPRVLMGDFNVAPTSTALKPIRRLFRDVLGLKNTPTANAAGDDCPSSGNRIDYVFVRHIRKEKAYVPVMSDDKNVSDHCPVVAKLLLP